MTVTKNQQVFSQEQVQRKGRHDSARRTFSKIVGLNQENCLSGRVIEGSAARSGGGKD